MKAVFQKTIGNETKKTKCFNCSPALSTCMEPYPKLVSGQSGEPADRRDEQYGIYPVDIVISN